MKKFLLTLVALVVACTVPHMGQAKTIESTLFTCKGELSKMADQYVITHEEEDNNLLCYIEDKPLRRILAVCHVGDTCTVSAKGVTGNGNQHIIEKVFEVQRSRPE